MTLIDRQVHGYRKGHQLLAGSVELSRDDQQTIDRLSDIAGSLRPREHFEPYLTGYPLPSSNHYVLARTWQDLSVSRAGCVRTLSLIIPALAWEGAESLSPFLQLLQLDRLPEDADATREALQPLSTSSLPPVTDFNSNELLEAIFLEDSQPVVVFDSITPELVAIRLLTALWRPMRRQFAVSTFALAPRKVSGRDFNLVFAPKDARSKFSDWNGRRIDGRVSQSARHRWTERIVDRVFSASHPTLLSAIDEELLPEQGETVDNAASLRIVFLWKELLAKLDSKPAAALGLLDIATSGKVRESLALDAIQPLLGNAVLRAPFTLPEAEAWEFLGAIERKMHGRSFAVRVRNVVKSAATDLAARSPEGALALLARTDDQLTNRELLPAIASGISNGFTDRAKHALLAASPEVLASLVAQSSRLAEEIANESALIERFGEYLPQLDDSLIAAVGESLLPYLVMDWQLTAAKPLIQILDAEELADEVRHLSFANDFAAPGIVQLCLQHAREIGARRTILSALSELHSSGHRDQFISDALDPTVEDSAWLLRDSGLSVDISTAIFSKLIERADESQLVAIFGDKEIGEQAVKVAAAGAPNVLKSVVLNKALPTDVFVHIVGHVLASTSLENRADIGRRALEVCLGRHFGGDEVLFISTMLECVGKQLDGAYVARRGVAREIDASVASRNLIAFQKASRPAKTQIVFAITDLAQAVRRRRAFDLKSDAAEALAVLFLEAEKSAPLAALSAAGVLLPTLMQQRKAPVSAVVAATFPMIYRELEKRGDGQDLLKLVPFLDWDRRKGARQELVSAFLASCWAPGDLALTACRCSDVTRVLHMTDKARGGRDYLRRIAGNLERVPNDCREAVEKVISAICSD